MTNKSAKNDDKTRRAALDDLKALRESDNVFTGSFAAMVNRAGSHFSANDDASGDRIEIWGKRIGRALSALGVVGLGIYLYATYLR